MLVHNVCHTHMKCKLPMAMKRNTATEIEESKLQMRGVLELEISKSAFIYYIFNCSTEAAKFNKALSFSCFC